MKYEKCITCKQLGNTCDGPNFLAMDAIELGQWCDEKRRKIPGMTYDRIASETNISKTAIYNFLKGIHPDCRLETIRPVVKLLIGGSWDDNPCGNVSSSEKAGYEEKIRQLEIEVEHLDTRLKAVKKTNESLEMLVKNNNIRTTDDKDFLRGQIKNRNKVITFLSVMVAVCMAVIITALVIDGINPEAGFFWNTER